ncbi:MAG: hypothetical protein QXP56_07745 [Archaeoglobaceae archaeon]
MTILTRLIRGLKIAEKLKPSPMQTSGAIRVGTKIIGYPTAVGIGLAGFGTLTGFGVSKLSEGIKKLTGDPIEQAKEVMKLKEQELKIDEQYFNMLKEYMRMAQQAQGTAGNMKNPVTAPEWLFPAFSEALTPKVPEISKKEKGIDWVPIAIAIALIVVLVLVIKK